MCKDQNRDWLKHLLALTTIVSFCGVPQSFGQQAPLLLASQKSEVQEEESSEDLPPIVSAPEKIQSQASTESETLDHEIVRERFKSGRIKTEREVMLNEEGDFVNDGQYRQWNEKGELVLSGTYNRGKKDGVWMQIIAAGDSKLMQSLPYNKFKPPFQSVAEFKEDEMTGFWLITDAENREISQLELHQGIRSGIATWKFPNGKVLYEANYTDGLLNGLYVERDSDGKIVRQTEYVDGRRIDIKREFYADKKPKAEMQILTNQPRLIAKDDFLNLTLASYTVDDASTPHGPFVLYHVNGAVRAKGQYVNGELDGKYESWHENGERECVGSYANGRKEEQWIWRHSNGMRRLVAMYKDGVLDGQMAAWNDQGRAVTPPTTMDAEVHARTATESGVTRR